MRRNRYDDDPVVNEYYENYRRAGVTLLLAFGLLIAWFAAWLVGEGGSEITAALNSLMRTVLGWGCVTAFAPSGLGYAYAFVYPRLVASRL